jgi:hypothetical protein
MNEIEATLYLVFEEYSDYEDHSKVIIGKTLDEPEAIVIAENSFASMLGEPDSKRLYRANATHELRCTTWEIMRIPIVEPISAQFMFGSPYWNRINGTHLDFEQSLRWGDWVEDEDD